MAMEFTGAGALQTLPRSALKATNKREMEFMATLWTPTLSLAEKREG
jgi:hypothetical protein